MKSKLLLSFLACFGFLNVHATIINVPSTYAHIQNAIDASNDGDTVVVAPGTYYENINFHGKRIMVTSLYYLAADTSYVTSTIINGSMPAHPDTGSCVIFNTDEDASSILQGFKITGGTGTKWSDIHGAGVFREGGGILIELSSPVIRHNFITQNSATDVTGVTSAGGGGIRIGDGNPIIIHNLITHNEARYGAGIVLNYTGAIIRNNIIASNTGGQDYHGGSAIWMIDNFFSFPKIIENNTIVNNTSSLSNGTGGLLVWQAADVIVTNNIIYGNTPAMQIKTISSAPQVSYSNVESGFAGTGNINSDPMFQQDSYFLLASSPCIDAGDMDPSYFDLENLQNPGSALWPSLGQLRNDMGAFGGPNAAIFASPGSTVGIGEQKLTEPIVISPNPFIDIASLLSDHELRNATLILYDSKGNAAQMMPGLWGHSVTISRDKLATGIYLAVLYQDDRMMMKQKLVIQ